MKRNKSKIFLSLAIAGLISFSSITPASAKCTSKEIKDWVIVGYRTETKADGTTITIPIKELKVVAVVTKCEDHIIVNFYIHSDAKGNVYMDGKQIGTNGKVTNMDINADISGRLKSIGVDPAKLGDVKIGDASKTIVSEEQFADATGYKTKNSQTLADWKEKMVEGNGVNNLNTSNLTVTKDGKLKGTVDFNIESGSGLSLEEIANYPNAHEKIREYVGKEHPSMAKAIDNIGSGKSVNQHVNFFSLDIPINRSYENKEEVIPPPPPNPPKPKDSILWGDAIGCPSYFTWSEITYKEVHTTENYYTDLKGGSHTYDKVSYIPQKFDYRIDFKTDVKITDAKNRDLSTNSIKSGYGIRVATKTTYKISGGGGRPHTANLNIQVPKVAYVMHDWNMTHIYKTQPKTTVLVSNGDWKFKTPVNPLSKTKSDVIYTDRDMADGTHKVYVEVKNIKVQGRNLCTKNSESIKIKGNMYQDYFIN